MTCILPFLLTILAPAPCAVYQEVKAAHWKAIEVQRFVHWTLDKPYTPRLLESLPLTIIEEPAPFACPGGWCLAHTSRFADRITIRFARPYADSHDLLFHELNHAMLEDREVGHGNPERDIFLRALNAWTGWIWKMPGDHPYHPGFLPCQGSP